MGWVLTSLDCCILILIFTWNSPHIIMNEICGFTHFSSFCLLEWVLERRQCTDVGRTELARANIWPGEPLFLCQSYQTGLWKPELLTNIGFNFPWILTSVCSVSSNQFPQVDGSVEGRCYRHNCTGPNSYQIQVWGSAWVDCPAGGATEVPKKSNKT